MAEPALLHLQGIYKRFQEGHRTRQLLRGVDMQLMPGQFGLLLGVSGCGKSTLLNICAGIEPPDSGEVGYHLQGSDKVCFSQMADTALTHFRRDNLGFVFQSFNLIPTLTAQENILFPAQLAKVAGASRWATTRLHELGLGELAGQFPERLSGGEQQRIAILRALSNQPKLVLADEPTGNLDSDNASQVIALLLDMVRNHNSALLMVSHDASLASHADVVWRLVDGVLIEE